MRKKIFPKHFIQTVTQDIIANINSNVGILTVLELFEEVPPEWRSVVLNGLSTVHEPAIAVFYHIVMREYGPKYEEQVLRSLQKLSMAGVETPDLNFMPGHFYKAFCSPTRHLGKVNLTVFWEYPEGTYAIESFLLHFSAEGIVSYVLLEDMHHDQLYLDDPLVDDLVELEEEAVCSLLSDAYQYNQKHQTSPALGFYLFQRYLVEELDSFKLVAGLGAICPVLLPHQAINTLFLALQKKDWIYLNFLSDEQYINEKRIRQAFSQIFGVESQFLEGRIKEIQVEAEEATVSAYILVLLDQKICKNNYTLRMHIRDKRWKIYQIEKKRTYHLKDSSRYNPLSLMMHCTTYEILDIDELITLIGELERVQEIGELPHGLHVRISAIQDNIDHGISFMSGVLADLVINGDEFVVICQEPSVLESLNERCMALKVLNKTGTYQLPLKMVLYYLGGSYINFEDIYMDTDYEYLLGDNMRFITARYVVEDQRAIRRYLEGVLQVQIYHLDTQTILCYHHLPEHSGDSFVAEYILDEDYLTVSSFGAKVVGNLRKQLEETLPSAISFESLEIRNLGLFEVLTPEVGKLFPQMEEELKNIYLNKWYYSNSPWLNGMCPFEANKTKDGERLLWSMFKIIQKKINNDYFSGQNVNISLREFMNRVGK